MNADQRLTAARLALDVESRSLMAMIGEIKRAKAPTVPTLKQMDRYGQAVREATLAEVAVQIEAMRR